MPINISKRTRPPGSPASLRPYLLQSMAGMPQPLPRTLQPSGWASLPPEALPYVIQTIWLLPLFYLLPSWLLHLVPLSAFSLPLPSLLKWPSSGSCPLWTLPDVSVSGYAFSLLSTTHFLLHHHGLSFSFLYFYFPIQTTVK